MYTLAHRTQISNAESGKTPFYHEKNDLKCGTSEGFLSYVLCSRPRGNNEHVEERERGRRCANVHLPQPGVLEQFSRFPDLFAARITPVSLSVHAPCFKKSFFEKHGLPNRRYIFKVVKAIFLSRFSGFRKKRRFPHNITQGKRVI